MSSHPDEPTSTYRRIKLVIPAGLERTPFQTSFGAVDQVLLVFCAGALAGVGLSNSISFIVMLFYSAIGTGSGVLIAQAFGRKNMEEVSATAALGQILAGMLGVCTALPLALFPGVVLRWTGAQENVANEAAWYFQLFVASAPFIGAERRSTWATLSTPLSDTLDANDHHRLAVGPTLCWIFLSPGDRPISETWGTGRRYRDAVGASCPVSYSNDHALSTKGRATMAMALAMLRHRTYC